MAQRRPTGPGWVIDQTWKDDVLQRMRERGVTRAQLSRLIGVSTAAITILFSPKTKQSRLVPAIHRALELTRPMPAVAAPSEDVDARRVRIDVVWDDLDESDRELMALNAEAYARRKP